MKSGPINVADVTIKTLYTWNVRTGEEKETRKDEDRRQTGTDSTYFSVKCYTPVQQVAPRTYKIGSSPPEFDKIN